MLEIYDLNCEITALEKTLSGGGGGGYFWIRIGQSGWCQMWILVKKNPKVYKGTFGTSNYPSKNHISICARW